jgi:hypothetical protein
MEQYPIVPQHVKAWCEKEQNCRYKWSCKFSHCGKDGVDWHKAGFRKTEEQIQAYINAMERGAPEAPYYRPSSDKQPPSPPRRNVPRRVPQTDPAQVTQVKRGRDLSQERLQSRERRNALEGVIMEATEKLRDQKSTEEERATAIREIQRATEELKKEAMDGAPRN